jgi:threonine dehydratase
VGREEFGGEVFAVAACWNRAPAEEIARREGLSWFIFDHPDIVAGQATCGEIVAPPSLAVLVPVGMEAAGRRAAAAARGRTSR